MKKSSLSTSSLMGLFAVLITASQPLHAEPISSNSPSAAGKPQQLTSPDQVPQGLEKSDWASIRAAHTAWKHSFLPTQGGWQARNAGQQWTTQFDGRGFLAKPKAAAWQWGLELRSYGFGQQQRMVRGHPAVKAEGQRLSYQWDADMQEWFINDQRGLEHGFTLARRPEGSAANAELDVVLGTRGTLKANVAADSQTVYFRDDAEAPVVTYAGLKVWDADGHVLPSRFVAGPEGRIILRVQEVGARYPITIDPIAQQAFIKASNSGENDFFGYSVALSGDTAVIGAYREDSNANTVGGNGSNNLATDSGAAYVFTRSEGTWSQQAYLKASNSEANDGFGRSVAVSGDTAVIGAYGEDSSATTVGGDSIDNSAPSSGAAYVFTRSGSTWTEQAYLKASNSQAFDYFGLSVAVSGDTAVIGAYGEDSNATTVGGNASNNSASASGAAYVFTRSGSTWTEQAYLKASNAEASDLFGYSVALSGDTAVIGAYLEDSNATTVGGIGSNNSANASGAAYVFTRSGTSWSQQAYLKANNPGAGDYFGLSVAVSGDTAVIGAYGEDSNANTVGGNGSNNLATDSGAAYVFTRSGSTWSYQAYLKANNSEANDFFGYSVALSGDTAVIGAYGEDSNATTVGGEGTNNLATNSGAAYVFTRSGTTWTPQSYLKANNSEALDYFGLSVAVSGDTAVIGAYSEGSNATTVGGDGTNNLANGSGAAYTFSVHGPVPVIAITGNSMVISNGDVTPSAADDTDFGRIALLNTQMTRTFNIINGGNAALNLEGAAVSLSGLATADFKVTAPPSASVPVGGRTSFDITFDPRLAGTREATVTVASDDSLNGSYSFTISGFGVLRTLLTQTITFSPPSMIFLSQTPLELSALASSGLPVTFGVTEGLASIDGSTLTVFGKGTVKVRAMQAGGGNYKPAAPVTVTIVVKDDPTLRTLGGLSRTYDGTPKEVQLLGGWDSPNVLYTVNGLKVLTPPVNAGRYAIEVIDQRKVTKGTLVIAKAPLIVTVDDKHKFAGQPNPALTVSYSGFTNGETVTVITRSPVLRTTATVNSVAGEYAITASGGTANNYQLIYQQGTMIVDSFSGNFEALLVDALDVPSGKLSLMVAKSGRSFSGSLALAGETTALRVSGPLATNTGTETASGSAMVVRNGVTYALTFTLPMNGQVTGAVTRANLELATAQGGRRLLSLPRGGKVNNSGAHTAVLNPAQPAGAGVPAGAGWARAAINSRGAIALVGKLGDGTAFTTSLLPDAEQTPGYRLWVQPYKPARTQTFVGGTFALSPHPLPSRRFIANDASLIWTKAERMADKSYPLGFAPLSVDLRLDPWIKPTPTQTLVTLLGLSGDSIEVAHSPTGSASDGDLPATVTLSTRNTVSVPGANNPTKWKTQFNTTNGTFTGSFELLDAGVKRVAPFSGVLRQPVEANDEVIGDGHFVIPTTPGSSETVAGEVLFTRP